MTDPKMTLGIVTALRDLWIAHPPNAEQFGDRVFVRWTDLTPDRVSWDDWRCVGIVRAPRSTFYPKFIATVPFEWTDAVHDAIARGDCRGAIASESGHVRIEWCRSSLDGPSDRVSDWSSPQPPNRRREG